jgi:hypothetical protein
MSLRFTAPLRSAALALLALGISSPGLAAQNLEELLERARIARAEAEAARAPQVRGWVTELVALQLQPLGSQNPREAERLRDRLAASGTAGARALICFFAFSNYEEALEALRAGPPPVGSSKQAQFLALSEASAALKRLRSAAVAPDLMALFAREGNTVRTELLGLLPHLDAAEVVVPFLTARFEEKGLENSLRALALDGLLTLDLGRREAWVRRALESEPSPIAAVVLRHLTAKLDAGFDVLVDKLAVDPQRPPELFDPLFRYWKALPKTIAAPEILAWLERIERNSIPEGLVGEVLRRLGRLPLPAKALEPKVRQLVEASAAPIQRAAEILLANLGDRGARRSLLDAADLVIERAEEGSWSGLQKRAELHLDLNDAGSALEDLRRVLKLNQDASPIVRRESFIAQGRAYALQSKLDKAADSLVDARLSPGDRKLLAQDPDFEELLVHPRHGSVLQP